MAFIAEAPNFVWGNHFFDAKNHQCIWERTATFGYTFFIGVILIAGKVVPSLQPFLRKVYIFHLIVLGLCGGACPVASRGLCNYRPHSKDGEDTVFTGVCLSTVGYPSPTFFPRSLVPGPFWGREGTPVPGSFSGLWSQVLSGGGVPQSHSSETGVPPSGDWGPHNPGNRPAGRVLATRREVCPLRSHRRTFLLQFFSLSALIIHMYK